ncbi:hypothetical protein NBO_53g0025 [Nosema bombycis CQ1]|uniref:Uncharacterized protein n=1 Tax=Nosema bombycis (strain CQ1 / CVCC 102059) TaxID=578461 RepID=R0KT07_NOSB1|nr:hypothetical protein NBO_53g0025 [Nosema bombycis CQ1]|eukprot:EOB13901.1 hypothetical protein NBO_53g0025 [Nosema bombycis CQ1]
MNKITRDFLVFSQTDYFKNTLSYRIIVNLELLEGLYSSQNTPVESEEKFLSEDKLQNNLENFNIINALKKAWKSILQDQKTLEFKNFESLLIQDKLPTPYICDESFYKPVFFENKKPGKKTTNLPKGDLGVSKNKLPLLKGKSNTNHRPQNEPKISNPVGGEPEDFSKWRGIFVISAYIILFIVIMSVCILCAIKVSD